MILCLLTTVLACGLTSPLPAQNPGDEPPTAGMPVDFSHIVGRYNITVTADRTEVFVEDPIIFKVRILGRGPKQYYPVRKLLRIFGDDLAEQFYVEPMPEQDRAMPRDGAWEFVYRLKPKTTDVRFIPGPKLVYYLPERRKYQTAFAEDIALTVKPRPEKKPEELGLKTVQAPEQLYRLATGDAVLSRENVPSSWPAAVLVGMLLGPPLLSIIGFLLWRRLFPDAARILHERRGQSARRAAHDLARMARPYSPDRFVAILTGYLGERFDFAAEEPTPAEVVQFLKRHGVAVPVRQSWADFLSACDAARFGPAAPEAHDAWPDQAVKLINALEAELSSRHHHGASPKRAHLRWTRNVAVSLVTLSIVLPVYASFGSNDSDVLRLAESAFQQGAQTGNDSAQARKFFAASARQFAQLHARGIANPDLYLNWGNAELLAERVPQAILAYRRGLRLAPGRPDLVENLSFARERVAHPPTASVHRADQDDWLATLVPWLWWLTGYYRLLLSLVTLVLYTLACCAAISWFWRRSSLLPGRAALLLIVASVSGYFWYREEMHLQRDRDQPLMVISQETSCRLGNGQSYPPLATLPTLNPGMEARRLAQRGDWLQIQMAGGVIGWVPREVVLVDE